MFILAAKITLLMAFRYFFIIYFYICGINICDAKGNADIIGRHRTGYSGTEIFNASSCNRRQPYIEGSS